MKTRDTDYKEHGPEDDETDSFNVLSSCGLNRFSRSEDSDAAITTPDAVDDDFTKQTDSNNWLKEFTEYLSRIFPLNYRKQAAALPLLKTKAKRRRLDESLGRKTEQGRRIVGGKKTEDGEWPWLAAIGMKALGPRCGGTLVADQWILTAAHCFRDEEDPCAYNVRLGSINWMRDQSGHSVDVTPDAIFRHPDFDEPTSSNDVALLRLSTSVNIKRSGFVNAICLPNVEKSVKPGTVCIAAGWGRQVAKKQLSTTEESQEVDLPVLGYEDRCGLYKNGTIKPGMICAGYLEGGKDTCQGDSGGPIMYERGGRWFQLGITSFGDGCARPGFPGIYTDVGRYWRWISSVVQRFS